MLILPVLPVAPPATAPPAPADGPFHSGAAFLAQLLGGAGEVSEVSEEILPPEAEDIDHGSGDPPLATFGEAAEHLTVPDDPGPEMGTGVADLPDGAAMLPAVPLDGGAGEVGSGTAGLPLAAMRSDPGLLPRAAAPAGPVPQGAPALPAAGIGVTDRAILPGGEGETARSAASGVPPPGGAMTEAGQAFPKAESGGRTDRVLPMAPPGQEGGSPASPTRGQRASLPEAPGADLARAPATRAKAAALAEKERFASIAAESVYPRESGHAPAARVLLGVNPPALMADPAGADPSGVGSAGAGPRVPATHADVGRQMRLALGSGTDGATEIRLDPPELGSLRLALHSSTSGLTLAIEVERAGTLDLVRRGIEGLAAELRSLGYDRVEITIDSGNAGARGGGAGTSGFPARADPGPDDRANIPTPAILSVPLSARRPDGGLDLRL